jgi:phosphate transport system protein
MLVNFQSNIKEIKNDLMDIGNGLLESNKLILEALQDCNIDKFNEAKSHIKNVAVKADSIDNLIIRVLALYTPEARDLRQVVAYMKTTNELTRACSNTRSYIRGFTDVCNEMDVEMIREYALPMQTSTVQAITLTLSMITCEDNDEIQEIYNDVLIEENKTDDLYDLVERNLSIQADSVQSFEKFHKMLRALRKSGKISNRAISIANLLVYAKLGGHFRS